MQGQLKLLDCLKQHIALLSLPDPPSLPGTFFCTDDASNLEHTRIYDCLKSPYGGNRDLAPFPTRLL